MTRLIYGCRFDVPDSIGTNQVVAEYSNWIQGHYRLRRGIQDFRFDLMDEAESVSLPPGHSIVVDRLATPDSSARIVRLQWTHPADSDPGLQWRNDVRVGDFNGQCSVEHQISISSTDYRMMATGLNFGSPGVIRRLCSRNAVMVGDMSVKATPYPLGSSDVGTFLELLNSPNRRLPIVFVAPYTNGESNQLDTSAIAQSLAGVGIVVDVRDPDATWEIADAIGRTWSCFNGGARTYWAGFNEKQDPLRHSLYVCSRIERFGAQAIARSIQESIFAVAAFRFVQDPRMNEAVREVHHAERIQRVEAQKGASSAEWETYALELDEKLTAANDTIAELQAEIDNLRDNQQVYLSSRALGNVDDVSDSEAEEKPKSVEDAVIRAKATCANLIFLDSASKAARKSPFQRPEEVLDALRDLNQIAVTDGDIVAQLKARGWGRSRMHISTTTRTRDGEEYEFEYDGRRQLFEPHITLGSGSPNSCASIHFIADTRSRKIVIGHVGKHLTNTKT